MDILPHELPRLTIAQLKTCTQLPDWLAPMLAGRCDDELCKVLYEELCEADLYRREFPALVGLGAFLGFMWGPQGALVGGLGGVLYALSDRPTLLARGQLPAGGSSRFAEFLKQPGPPFTEPLEDGGWIDRRYLVSEHLPVRELRRNSQGQPTEFRARFRQLDIRCCLQQKQITLVHPTGDLRTFPGLAHYGSELRLYPLLDGQLLVCEQEAYPDYQEAGLRRISWSEARERIPFPPDWVDPEAVAGDSPGC